MRALTAESLVDFSIRIISTSPSPDFGMADATPASTAREQRQSFLPVTTIIFAG